MVMYLNNQNYAYANYLIERMETSRFVKMKKKKMKPFLVCIIIGPD